MIPIDPAQLDRRGRYFLLTSCVVPRPIAWVTTRAVDGVLNAAPFSFFNGVCADPPVVSIAVGRRRGDRKDTLANVEATGELVVNAVDATMGQAMADTSVEYEAGVDELERVGLATEPSEIVAPPRIAGVPIAMECRLLRTVEVGHAPSTLILAEILRFHVREGLFRDDGVVDPAGWTPLGRLAGKGYAPVTEIREIAPARHG